MTAVSFSVPGESGWRWRIVNDSGEAIEESRSVFATLALALNEGSPTSVRSRICPRLRVTGPRVLNTTRDRSLAPWSAGRNVVAPGSAVAVLGPHRPSNAGASPLTGVQMREGARATLYESLTLPSTN